ncbi:Hpt domain-containing protein [Azonexus sp.]|uniref:Hpt domain-containing protein n=1 Tax=Azonexus sp. TaxID=1872668 RepID=UPI0039E69018
MMQIPHELEGFQVDDAIARMLGRPQLWWQTLGYFVRAFADWPQRWQESRCAATDERRAVHALRSAAANVGAHDLADAARQLEQSLSGSAADEHGLAALRIHLLAAFTLAWENAATAWAHSGAALPE